MDDFELERFLGSWFEIARLDNAIEKDLDNVMSQYSLNTDGTIKVINSGYHRVEQHWKKTEGIARFRHNHQKGDFSVNFLSPVYKGYNIISVDEGYNYALITGSNLNYLWMMSRHKTIPEQIKRKYLKLASLIGFNTEALLWVNQDREDHQ